MCQMTIAKSLKVNKKETEEEKKAIEESAPQQNFTTFV